MKTANHGLPALQAFSNHRSPAMPGRYIDPDSEAAYSLAELVSETTSLEGADTRGRLLCLNAHYSQFRDRTLGCWRSGSRPESGLLCESGKQALKPGQNLIQ